MFPPWELKFQSIIITHQASVVFPVHAQCVVSAFGDFHAVVAVPVLHARNVGALETTEGGCEEKFSSLFVFTNSFIMYSL